MDDRRRHLAPSQPESCGVAGRGGDRGQTRPYPWTPFGRASGLRARASGGASVGSPRCARMATITSLSEISATIASARTATPECAPFEWAQLLRRIHGVDVLPCPYSGRRAIVRGLHRASLPSVHSADSVRASIPREVMNTDQIGPERLSRGDADGAIHVSEGGRLVVPGRFPGAVRCAYRACRASGRRARDQGERPDLTHDEGARSRSSLPSRCHAKRSSCAVEGRRVPNDGK
jgi:hypothetical protein